MMKKRKKILLITAASLVGLLFVVVVAALITLQTSWFANYAKGKLVAIIDDSTGGSSQIGSLQIDLRHLTVRVKNFVLHGKEPRNAEPLLQVSQLEIRVKLLSSLSNVLDLQYLGIDSPRLHIITMPGGTNIPEPKTTSPSTSQKSGLETVVDLAVKRFEINNGFIGVLDQQKALSGRGENLRVVLNYKPATPSYVGNIAFDPILIRSGSRVPLNFRLNVPVALEKDAIRIDQGTLSSSQSAIHFNVDLENLKTPTIRTSLNAHVSLPELQRSLGVLPGVDKAGAPKELRADLSATVNEKQNTIQIERAHLDLGQTTLQAASQAGPGSPAQFSANFALNQLLSLMNVSSPQVRGDLEAKGVAHLDSKGNYSVDGNLSSRDLTVKSGTTEVSNLSIASPFHADPYLISMDGLRIGAFGGSLAAKIFVEKLAQLSVEARLRNFSIPQLVSSLTGKQLGYDGLANGVVKAKGDLKAKGTTGYSANAKLDIIPGRHGLPLSGRIYGTYAGAGNVLTLNQSYVALPNTRLNVNGVLNKRIELKFVSENLNDLLPAINFGAKQPLSTLPVTLQGGNAALEAHVLGPVANPRITAHAEMTDFAAEKRPFSRLAVDAAASLSGAQITDGVLTGRGLSSTFDAALGLSHWQPLPRSPLQANLAMHNADLGALAALSGSSSLEASGTANADIHINGTYGNPLGQALVRLTDGSVNKQPFSQLLLNVNLADQLITLKQLELDTAGGSVQLTGVFHHPSDSFMTGHAQLQLHVKGIQLAAIEALARQKNGVAGQINLAVQMAGDLGEKNKQTSFTLSNVTADLSARGLQIQNQNAGSLTANAQTQNGKVSYQLTSDFAGSDVSVKGLTALTGDYFTTAQAAIHDLSVAKTLKLVGQSAVPAEGAFSADAHVNGTLKNPDADLQFGLSKAHVYQEAINALKGHVQYSNQLVQIPNLDLNLPAGTVSLTGSFKHPVNDFNTGALALKVTSSDIAIAKIEHVKLQKPGLGGTLHLAADLSAQLRQKNGKPELLFSKLNADLSAAGIHLDDTQLGGLTFKAATKGQTLDFHLDSDLAKSQVHGSGQAQLSGDYLLRGKLTFNNLRYSNFAPLLASEAGAAPAPFEALAEGQTEFNGPMTNFQDFAAQLRLDRLDLQTKSNSQTGGPSIRTVKLQNKGPLLVALDHQKVQIKQFEITGRDTSLKASGVVNLANSTDPLALNLKANLDLGLLQDADRDFYSSGLVDLDASLRGSFANPRASGQIVLKNASVNYAASPNGLSNANGVIVLNGTNASIEKLSGESGGGKVNLTGFVGLGSGIPSFNLKATAQKVRVRYSGLSVVSNSTITLVGNTRRSLLSGSVSLERLTYASSSDTGSLLSSASTPPTTPASPSPFLTGMRLDIRILTAPDIQVVSTYANRFSILANLTVRGTAETPGMLGRVTVTDGQLVFFGNTYTVTTGTVNFYDPNNINPVLNFSLQTVAQGVNVTLGVTGPMEDLQLNYRSDPPLTFEQIVQLLATNTTPSNPVIAAHQPTPPQQSLSQMGESALLGQAVANPLASRVQRVFGLTQLKIDPSFTGSNGQPSARVTLQEKVASNITFTYITDVSQTNSQIVRVQWDLTNNLSAVGLRDYNGAVSIEFFYKFTRR